MRLWTSWCGSLRTTPASSRTRAAGRGPGGLPEVGVNDLDVRRRPAQLLRAPAQGVLEAQALLVGEHLVGAGLADVDDRLPAEVVGLHQLGCEHRGPPLRWA